METKIVVTLVVKNNDEHNKLSVCERVDRLFEYGSMRDAFGDAGLELVDCSVAQPPPGARNRCNVCMVPDHDVCANDIECSCCRYSMENK